MKNKQGFSLIELLVTIAIMGVLTGLAVVMYQKNVEGTKKSRNEVNAKLLYNYVITMQGLGDKLSQFNAEYLTKNISKSAMKKEEIFFGQKSGNWCIAYKACGSTGDCKRLVPLGAGKGDVCIDDEGEIIESRTGCSQDGECV